MSGYLNPIDPKRHGGSHLTLSARIQGIDLTWAHSGQHMQATVLLLRWGNKAPNGRSITEVVEGRPVHLFQRTQGQHISLYENTNRLDLRTNCG